MSNHLLNIMKQPTRFPKYQIHTRVYTDSTKFIQDTTFKYRTCCIKKVNKAPTILNEIITFSLMIIVLAGIIWFFAWFEKGYLS